MMENRSPGILKPSALGFAELEMTRLVFLASSLSPVSSLQASSSFSLPTCRFTDLQTKSSSPYMSPSALSTSLSKAGTPWEPQHGEQARRFSPSLQTDSLGNRWLDWGLGEALWKRQRAGCEGHACVFSHLGTQLASW